MIQFRKFKKLFWLFFRIPDYRNHMADHPSFNKVIKLTENVKTSVVKWLTLSLKCKKI